MQMSLYHIMKYRNQFCEMSYATEKSGNIVTVFD